MLSNIMFIEYFFRLCSQGVQAQTVANFYLAFTQDLAIIPVLNKVDLKNAEPELVAQQLNTLFSINTDEILKVSLVIIMRKYF